MRDLFFYFQTKLAHFGVRRYAAHLGWLFFARIATLAIAFVATTYIARSLGPVAYGELSYAISFTALFGFIASLGIDQVLYREILLEPSKRNIYMGTAIVLRLLSGAIAMAIAIITALMIAADPLSLTLIAILATTFVFGTGQLLGQEFQADAEAKYPSLLAIAITIILNVLKIIVIANDEGVIYLGAVLALEPILYLIGLAYLRRQRYGPLSNWSFDTSLVRPILVASAPLMFVSAFYMVYARIDQVFIKHMIDTASVGYYDAAVRLVELWYFVPSIIITGLVPAIANAKRTNDTLYHKRAKKLLFAVLIGAISIAALNSLAAELIVSIVFGASFAAAAPVLALYVWSNVGSALVYVSQQILILEKLSFQILIASFCGMATNVVLCLLWIPEHGMAGAALASVVAYIIPFCTLFLVPRTRALFISILRA